MKEKSKKPGAWVCKSDFFEIEGASLLRFDDALYKDRYGKNLPGVEIPEGVSRVAEGAFRRSHVTGVRFSGPNVTVEKDAFAECKRLSVAKFRCVARIGDYAFRGCPSLGAIEVSEGETAVGEGAFQDCAGLESACFYAVESVGDFAFSGCLSLEKIETIKGAIEKRTIQACERPRVRAPERAETKKGRIGRDGLREVYLIGCVGEKQSKRAGDGVFRADELYQSDIFKKELSFARARACDDDIFIISAKYRLKGLDDEIRGYDLSLKVLARDGRAKWGEAVLADIGSRFDFDRTRFVVLAGNDYAKALGLPSDRFCGDEKIETPFGEKILHWTRPVRKGLQGRGAAGIGCQKRWLKENIANLDV